MKRFICFLLVAVLCMSALTAVCAADEDNAKMILVSETTEYLPDGSFLLISVYEEQVKSRSSCYKKTGSKFYILHNNNGTELWKFTVNGVFDVNQGVSAVCTSSVSSHEIYNNDWHFSGSTCRVSGNQAIGDAEFVKKLLGIKVETETCHVVLTCDVNGNLS